MGRREWRHGLEEGAATRSTILGAPAPYLDPGSLSGRQGFGARRGALGFRAWLDFPEVEQALGPALQDLAGADATGLFGVEEHKLT